MPTPPPATPKLDIATLFADRPSSRRHGANLGLRYVAHGMDWVELAIDYRADLIGNAASGVLASGPIITLMDSATGLSVALRRGVLEPMATLDLRIDYLRAAVPGRSVIGHGECYKAGRAVSFVRGYAHEGDPADPIAHVSGTFMLTDAQ